MTRPSAVVAVVVLLTLTGSSCAETAAGPRFDDAWTRPMPTVSNVSAIYGVLVNDTDAAFTVVAAQSSRCAEMVIHETDLVDGVMTMSDVDEAGLTVPPDASVEFVPNGLHFMCLGTDEPFVEGDTVTMTLTLSSGDELTNTVSVEQR